MSLASLAAYASSDEGDEGSSECVSTAITAAPVLKAQASGVHTEAIKFEDGSSSPPHMEQQSNVLDCLFEADDIVDDVPLASAIPNKNISRPKRIVLRPLVELEEDEQPRPKKLKDSNMKPGLFSLLPQPKGCSKGSSLVPASVSRSSGRTRTAAKLCSSVTLPPVAVDSAVDSEDEDMACAIGKNYFSLSASIDGGSCEVQHSPGYSETPALESGTAGSASSAFAPAVCHPPGYAPVSEQPSSDSLLNGEALDRLCGRRRRVDECGSVIIDVNQDDMLPDKRQLENQILASSSIKPRPQKYSDDPTAQQRRKHQITYLAHQAKDREVELQLEWSQNRATKQAYKNKYGF